MGSWTREHCRHPMDSPMNGTQSSTVSWAPACFIFVSVVIRGPSVFVWIMIRLRLYFILPGRVERVCVLVMKGV